MESIIKRACLIENAYQLKRLKKGLAKVGISGPAHGYPDYPFYATFFQSGTQIACVWNDLYENGESGVNDLGFGIMSISQFEKYVEEKS